VAKSERQKFGRLGTRQKQNKSTYERKVLEWVGTGWVDFTGISILEIAKHLEKAGRQKRA
jgi:hypothetical protein